MLVLSMIDFVFLFERVGYHRDEDTIETNCAAIEHSRKKARWMITHPNLEIRVQHIFLWMIQPEN